jgi:hypothetical protein
MTNEQQPVDEMDPARRPDRRGDASARVRGGARSLLPASGEAPRAQPTCLDDGGIRVGGARPGRSRLWRGVGGDPRHHQPERHGYVRTSGGTRRGRRHRDRRCRHRLGRRGSPTHRGVRVRGGGDLGHLDGQRVDRRHPARRPDHVLPPQGRRCLATFDAAAHASRQGRAARRIRGRGICRAQAVLAGPHDRVGDRGRRGRTGRVADGPPVDRHVDGGHVRRRLHPVHRRRDRWRTGGDRGDRHERSAGRCRDAHRRAGRELAHRESRRTARHGTLAAHPPPRRAARHDHRGHPRRLGGPDDGRTDHRDRRTRRQVPASVGRQSTPGHRSSTCERRSNELRRRRAVSVAWRSGRLRVPSTAGWRSPWRSRRPL